MATWKEPHNRRGHFAKLKQAMKTRRVAAQKKAILQRYGLAAPEEPTLSKYLYNTNNGLIGMAKGMMPRP